MLHRQGPCQAARSALSPAIRPNHPYSLQGDSSTTRRLPLSGLEMQALAWCLSLATATVRRAEESREEEIVAFRLSRAIFSVKSQQEQDTTRVLKAILPHRSIPSQRHCLR